MRNHSERCKKLIGDSDRANNHIITTADERICEMGSM